jgi:hypothetical protein
MMGRTLLLAVAWAMAFNPAAHSAGNGADASRAKPSTASQGMNFMKIRVTINGKAMNATLIASATAKDFLPCCR